MKKKVGILKVKRKAKPITMLFLRKSDIKQIYRPGTSPKEDEEAWLNPDVTEPEHLLPLLKPYPAEHMETWRVGDGAKNPRNDTEELIKLLIV
jgi:putative SOS response-associated peptidase YedK